MDLIPYKTLYGGRVISTLNGETPGRGGTWITTFVEAVADAVYDLEQACASMHAGTAVSGTGTGITAVVTSSKRGDMYFNTDTHGVYTATATNTWSYVGDLDGFSPTFSSSKSGVVTTVVITDLTGAHSFTVSDGVSPSASVSKSGGSATITITDSNGTTTATVSDGQDGSDGYTPTASVSKSGSTATITITDGTGTTTATVSDGQNGSDGYTPVASVSRSGDSAIITITDSNGTTTAAVSDGVTGFNPVITDSSSTPSITLTDGGDWNLTSSGITAITLTAGSGWTSSGVARFSWTCPSTAPTLSYPATWICVGDDCSARVWTPTAGDYYCFIESRPVGTFLTVQKY